MSLKKSFKLNKIKLLWMLVLFVALGVWKIFTLENIMTGELYHNSLFQQYAFQYQHAGDAWYEQKNKYFWLGYASLHLISVYVFVSISAFIINRLRGKE